MKLYIYKNNLLHDCYESLDNLYNIKNNYIVCIACGLRFPIIISLPFNVNKRDSDKWPFSIGDKTIIVTTNPEMEEVKKQSYTLDIDTLDIDVL